MKKLILLIIFLAVYGSYAQEIRVMTFNIKYDNPSDSIYSWNSRKPLVFKMLKKEKPDIIGTQEVLKNQAQDFLRNFPVFGWYGVGRDDGKDQGEFSAIFFNKIKFSRLDGGTFWLSQQPDLPGSKSWRAACPRIVTWVKLRALSDNRIFYVFNTHFDHESVTAREKSAGMLIHAIDTIAGGAPVIITGDFNDHRNSRMFRALEEDLTEARKLHTPPFPPAEQTYIGFPYKKMKDEEIDFIFVKNSERLSTLDYHAVTRNSKGNYPSDHLPVVAVIKFLK